MVIGYLVGRYSWKALLIPHHCMVGVAFPLLSGPAWMTWLFAGLLLRSRRSSSLYIYLVNCIPLFMFTACFASCCKSSTLTRVPKAIYAYVSDLWEESSRVQRD